MSTPSSPSDRGAAVDDDDEILPDADAEAEAHTSDTQATQTGGSQGDTQTTSQHGIDESVQKIRVLPGASDDAASFEFEGEDHTLGNALRYVIMKNPDVEFCAYSIPHPSEPKMNVRIQMYEGLAFDALEKGLTDLEELCGVVLEKFGEAREKFPRPDPIP